MSTLRRIRTKSNNERALQNDCTNEVSPLSSVENKDLNITVYSRLQGHSKYHSIPSLDATRRDLKSDGKNLDSDSWATPNISTSSNEMALDVDESMAFSLSPASCSAVENPSIYTPTVGLVLGSNDSPNMNSLETGSETQSISILNDALTTPMNSANNSLTNSFDGNSSSVEDSSSILNTALVDSPISTVPEPSVYIKATGVVQEKSNADTSHNSSDAGAYLNLKLTKRRRNKLSKFTKIKRRKAEIVQVYVPEVLEIRDDLVMGRVSAGSPEQFQIPLNDTLEAAVKGIPEESIQAESGPVTPWLLLEDLHLPFDDEGLTPNTPSFAADNPRFYSVVPENFITVRKEISISVEHLSENTKSFSYTDETDYRKPKEQSIPPEKFREQTEELSPKYISEASDLKELTIVSGSHESFITENSSNINMDALLQHFDEESETAIKPKPRKRRRRSTADMDIINKSLIIDSPVAQSPSEMEYLPLGLSSRRSKRLRRKSISIYRAQTYKEESKNDSIIDGEMDVENITSAETDNVSPKSNQEYDEKCLNNQVDLDMTDVIKVQTEDNSASISIHDQATVREPILDRELGRELESELTVREPILDSELEDVSETGSPDGTDVGRTSRRCRAQTVNNTQPAVCKTTSRKKKAENLPSVEDIYLNKLWRTQMPVEKTWETIFEKPVEKKSGVEYLSKKKTKRAINSEDFYTKVRLKKRRQKALKQGWKPVKHSQKDTDLMKERIDILMMEIEYEDQINQ